MTPQRLIQKTGSKLPRILSLAFLRASPSIRTVGENKLHEFRFMVDGQVDRHAAAQRKAVLAGKSGEVKPDNVRMMSRAFISFEGEDLRVFSLIALEQLNVDRTMASIRNFLISEIRQVLRPSNDSLGEYEADYVTEGDALKLVRYLDVVEHTKAKSISRLELNDDGKTFHWVETHKLEE